MEPLSAIAITSLAFIATKAGEKALDKSLDAVWDKVNLLRKKISDKLRGDDYAESALQKAEAGDRKAFEDIADCLKLAMKRDPEFAEEIQLLASELDQEISKNDGMTQNNYDQAQGYQVKNLGGTNYIGDIKIYQTPPD